ncbi:3',5'-cyclic adenosine monophosphate phosphodiesterase CpdA [Microbacterium sp. 8M]|uniref:metallophosphoesterase n=1 Tax=Microbacterium sp. 8M TaxID=2653153 RepID=UPI0012F426E3|nr:metallophosphoesterase [Microbacterium sp. 8M]VXB05655.1 3',5'-cyclic adenosine monophosphate phosphodiesterase CpdA [Microbacterium sp. 8M]
MTVQFGRYAPPTHTLVHLSDPHLLAGGAALGGRFDVDRTLARTLAAIENAVERPDAIVVTGDLADLGEPDAYRRLRAAVEPVSERLGAPVIWVAGNHDERPALREHLLAAPPSEDPLTAVWDLNGLRVIALDSTVPGWHHGDLDEAQRAWLAEQLATPAPHGTLLAMHHPPVPSHIPFFDILELRHQDELAEIVRGSDVRGILAGHLHYSLHATFAGIPVSVASATCYTMDVASPGDRVNGMDAAQSFQLVHVRPETITHTVVPVVEATPVDTFSPEWVARMAQLTPQQRLEAFSRKPGR